MKYAIVQIKGKQYKVEPGKPVLVDFLGDVKEVECNEVLLLADGDKLDVGAPFLKQGLKFDVVENIKEKKVRVFKYHSKSNTRKTSGIRPLKSRIQIQA